MNATDIKTFEFAPGMSLQAILKDGHPWFVAKEVCDALGYANSRDALAGHVDEDEKATVAITYGIPGNPNRTVISESGLYSLILRSNKAEAKAFRRWVTGTVLPALRQGGVYVVGQEKVDLASLNFEQAQVHIEGLKAKVAEAEAIRWALSREEKSARRLGFKMLKGRSGRSKPKAAARSLR